MKNSLWFILLGSELLIACTSGPEFSQPNLGNRAATILEIEEYKFKDLNKNGTVDPYEDWRLPVDQRIDNLIAQMTLEEKVGFMLISTTRLAGDFAFQPGAPRGEITSGFNEEDLIQQNNMFTRQPLATSLMSA